MQGAGRYVRLRAEDFCAELAVLFAALPSLVGGGGAVGGVQGTYNPPRSAADSAWPFGVC